MTIKKKWFNTSEIDHKILRGWLTGTTCNHYNVPRSVLFENDIYIVMKHPSHSSYQDRCAGVVCCKSYASLYLKSSLENQRNLMYNYSALKTWTGRISKKRIESECKEMGIIFIEGYQYET